MRRISLSLKRLKLLVFPALLLALSSCDPGVALEPAGWEKVDDTWFRKQSGAYDLQVSGIHDLAGEKNLTITLKVHNNSDADVTLTNAALTTVMGGFNAKAPEQVPWNPVPPKGDGQYMMDFEFGNTLHEVLAGEVVLSFNLNHGGQTTVALRYVKVPIGGS